MLITAIDPGPRTSGWVRYDATRRELIASVAAWDRNRLLWEVEHDIADLTVVEEVACYGQRIGREVMRTIECVALVEHASLVETVRLTRPEVIRHFCGVRNAPKGQVNAALYDRFGGSRSAAVGTKSKPGPLHGMTGHAFDALALAIAYSEGLRPKDQEQEIVGHEVAHA